MRAGGAGNRARVMRERRTRRQRIDRRNGATEIGRRSPHRERPSRGTQSRLARRAFPARRPPVVLRVAVAPVNPLPPSPPLPPVLTYAGLSFVEIVLGGH